MQAEKSLNPQTRINNLSEILVYRNFSKTFLTVSIICFLLIQLLSLSNWFIIMTASENPIAYLIGWAIGIVLFIIWLIIYSTKNSKVILNSEKLRIEELNYFLQTKVYEIENFKIREFSKFRIQNRLESRPHQTYKIGFWNINNEFIVFPSNLIESEYQTEKIMNDLELFKQKNKLTFVVKNQNFQTEMPNYLTSGLKNSVAVASLILFYLLLPLITTFIFNLFTN